jgi:hypothetical protein
VASLEENNSLVFYYLRALKSGLIRWVELFSSREATHLIRPDFKCPEIVKY